MIAPNPFFFLKTVLEILDVSIQINFFVPVLWKMLLFGRDYTESEDFLGYYSHLKVKSLSRVRLCDPMDGSPLGSSVHGILQARI